MYPPRLYPGEPVKARSGEGMVALLRWWDPVSWVRAGLRARNSELLVVPWITPFHAFAVRVIGYIARRPVVLIVHNVRTHERFPFGRILSKVGLGVAERFVVHAKSLADELDRLGMTQSCTTVAHPPNLEVPATPLPPYPPVRFLCLGLVRPYKGVDIAIRSLSLLRDEGYDATLSVIGEVWGSGEEIRRLVQDLDLTDSVTLQSRYVPDEELAGVIAAHHALVASYRSASQSGVIPLALAGGRPAVVTPVGGLPEIIKDGKNGVVASGTDPQSVAEAMTTCIDRLDSLAPAEREDASWDDVAAAVLRGG